MSFVIPKYVARNSNYLLKLSPFIDKNVIKVVLGQRRVGKSFFLFEIMALIRSNNANANIIYINMELMEFDNIKNYQDLSQYLDSKIIKNQKNYIFIDEIQDIEGFEKSLRSLQAEGIHDLYVTGSNAFLLSGELSTYLSGRYIDIHLHTLSYTEFLKFHQLGDSNTSFLLYLELGGLPFLVNLPLKSEIVFEYIKSIYSAILFKDVVARHEIRNVSLLENMVKLLADSTGSVISAKSISDFLKSQRMEISPSVILNYLGYLEQAFFVNKASRVEIVGRKQLEIGQKYYFEDLGLRNSLIGFKQTDMGKMLENIVYLHLKICGYTVFVGKLATKEIDFVAEKSAEKVYVQVAYQITNDSTKEREFGNLLAIKDNYPKYVVSFDEAASGNINGVKHVHVRNFLVNFS